MQTMHEISIKSVLKSTLSKMQYLYWCRIEFKVAEITVYQKLLFSRENYVGGVHLINVSYSVRQTINKSSNKKEQT